MNFGVQSYEYKTFTDLLIKYSKKTLDIPNLIVRVAEIFSKHPRLIAGFEKFIPDEYINLMPTGTKRCL